MSKGQEGTNIRKLRGLLLVAIGLFLSSSSTAQLNVHNGVGNRFLRLPAVDVASILPPSLGGAAGAMSGWKSDEGPTSPVSLFSPSLPRAFDFTRTAPHLAFFCRLEINEEAGGIIPAKFRLGGHRYWQDNLLRH